jgi:hypothetical protein
MLYKFVIDDELESFSSEMMPNLFKFDPIFLKFPKFHIYRWEPKFFPTGKKNLATFVPFLEHSWQIHIGEDTEQL